ncbi:MAG: glycosidase [Dehalococcoidia bacterium]
MKQLNDKSKTEPEAARSTPFEELENRYHRCMADPLARAGQIMEADIVVGIPYYDEADTLPHVIRTAIKGIERHYPEAHAVIVAAGSPAGKAAHKAAQATLRRRGLDYVAFFLEDEMLNGKGWAIRAILEIADKLGADVALLEADLKTSSVDDRIEGLSGEWIRLLLEPIKTDQADIVASRFITHCMDTLLCSHLSYPLLAAVFNRPIRCLMGGQWGISHSLLRTYLNNPRYAWETSFSGYGVDCWIATAAITGDYRVCEANLGTKIHRRSGGKEDLIFRQVANALFQEILNQSDWWGKAGKVESAPVIRQLPSFGFPEAHFPERDELNQDLSVWKFQLGFDRFHSIYEKVLDEESYADLERLSRSEKKDFVFPLRLWPRIVYSFLVEYCFGTDFARGDILNALIPMHDGLVASRARRFQELEEKLDSLPTREREVFVCMAAEREIEELVDEFHHQRDEFVANWEEKAARLEPLIPPITYREFIPGVPLIVPTELTGRSGNLVTANGIYANVFSQIKGEFEDFVFGHLGVPREARSMDINIAIKDFLKSVEESFLPSVSLTSIEGTTKVVKGIFDSYPCGDAFCLSEEVAAEVLRKYPPLGLLTRFGHTNLVSLLEEHDPCDMLALSMWSEEREYTNAVQELLVKWLKPEHFTESAIKFIVVKHEDFPSLVELRSSTALDRLTARIVVSNLHKGMGGEFPKLRYFTMIAKDIVEAERFGDIWRRYAAERKDFGLKVVNSIRGHWGREPLSAHNIFEDTNHRILADRVRQMANHIREEGDGQLADKLKALADSYPLALIMPDGKFVTCSAWSWASYSFKGGMASPPPLSVHVERDWASREFLVEYFKSLGGSDEEVEEKIIELMGKGLESENLAPALLGTEKEAEEFVSTRPIAAEPEQPPAGEFLRFSGNPVLKPIKKHPWESKYVLNAGAIKLDGKVYLAYRAFGKDEISRIGLAVSRDGFNFSKRLPDPIFEPNKKYEARGCEDPRLTIINDRIYMAYTVFDGTIAQIALASIGIKDFVEFRWKKWRRHGLVFPTFTDKDAVLFPEQFGGRYALLHRVDPHIWITFSRHLRCPWPRKKHKILAGATSGMMWDGIKIGGGAQPIKTKYGWLLITHSVDYARVYRLGIMLLDLEDPSKLLYRSPNPVLEPATEMELGHKKSWVSNVVFTCGAVPSGEVKEIFSAEDELILYYGAADSTICAATATIGSLIPAEYLVENKE